jgi:hypothetical protein
MSGSTSPKFNKGDYVKLPSRIASGSGIGLIRTPIGQRYSTGEWYYEVESASPGQFMGQPTPSVFILDESEMLPANSSYQSSYYSNSHTTPSGFVSNSWMSMDPELDSQYISQNSYKPSTPQCECGLHKIDPKRTYGHSHWCPLSSNN